MHPAWGCLVQRTLRFEDVRGIQTLLSAHALDPKLEELCPELLKPVILDSQKAPQLKREHEARLWRPVAKAELCGPTLPTSDAIRLALSQLEEGDLTCWVRLCRLLAEDGNGRVVSTWVASELRRDLSADGILLNREVVIRSEDRLDILVEANCRDAKTDQFRQIRVIVEVKRDFNAGIDHAMETQLSQQYLSDNNCQTGLYLVAWFNRNRRRGKEAHERLNEFRAKLKDQAAKLSTAGKNLSAWVLDCSLLKQTEITKPKHGGTKATEPGKSARRRRTQRRPRKD